MFDTILQTFAQLIEEGETYLFLLPIYLTLLGGERIAHALVNDRPWDNRDAASNLFITGVIMALNMAVGHLVPMAVMVVTYAHFSLFTLGDGWIGWAIALLLYDLCWYVDHRIGHRVGLFWSMHHVHHSSEEFNTTVASRGFLVDTTLLSRPCFFLLPVLGVSPEHFLGIVIFTNIWGIAQHTRMVRRLPGLDWLLATPSNHRVHHGRDPLYLDRNYGEVLMIWDHLFGTYQREQHEPNYGVVHPIGTYHPVRIQVAGVAALQKKMRAACRWQDKLRCLHRPPEWQPEPAAQPSPALPDPSVP